MSATRWAGLAIPGEVQIAGFDDIPTLRDVSPTLTTVRLPLEEIGEWAVALAVDDGPPQVRAAFGEVLLRESTNLR